METVQVSRKNGVCIFKYSGELTLEVVDRLKEEIGSYLQNQDCDSVVMDLSGVSFLDSSGIGFLVHLNNQRKEQGKGFYIYNPSSQVRKTLSLVRLLDYFQVLEQEKDLDKLAQ